MKSLVLIDLSHLFWSSWHATADMDISEAFERTIAKVNSLRGEDYVVCCVDSPPYFRKELLPTYKAQRDAPPPQAVEQFTRVKRRLEADGMLLWAAKGFEADDIAATAVAIARTKKIPVVACSADKDWLQLVDDDADVRVVSTASGKMYQRVDVIEKLGVSPDMVIDLLALWGDKGDNVPGIPSVGAVTAAKLLNQYGSLDEVLANADKQTAKLCANLIEHADAARLARKLVALRTDAPINFDELFQERKPKPLREMTMPSEDDGFEDDAREEEEDVPISPPPKQPAAPKPEPVAASAPQQDLAPAPRKVAPEEKSSSQVVVHQGDWSLTLEPSNLKQAWWLAQTLAESRLYAKWGSPHAAYAVMLRGRSLGLDATTALSVFHNIEGNVCMHADLIEALVLRSGKAEYFDIVETTSKNATYATKRIGSRREVVISFSIEDAFNAGLVEKHQQGVDGYRGRSSKGPTNWDKYRATMLRHRAKTQLCRAVYADVVLGLYTPDEFSDGNSSVIDADFEAA
jgi:5'-3' exonuclease